MFNRHLMAELAHLQLEPSTPVLDHLLRAQWASGQGDWQAQRLSLMQAAGVLHHRAQCLQGQLRQRHQELAQRLTQQAQAMVQGLPTTALPRGPQPPAANPLPVQAQAPVRPPAAAPSPAPAPAQPMPSPSHNPGALDAVLGAEAAKRLFRLRYLLPLRHPQLARRFGQAAQGGVLLYGPPGTGKTHLVRALAASLGVPVLTVSPAQMLSKWLGESEKQLAALFEQARSHPAALVFIDEIDALAINRDEGGEQNGAMHRLLTQLLTELDGFARHSKPLMFIGATNRPWALDAALLRPGRFDALHYLGLPHQATRSALLQSTLAEVPQAPALPWAAVAKLLSGCTVAEVQACAQQAARLAFEDAVQGQAGRVVTEADMRAAAAQTPHSVQAESLLRYAEFAQAHGLPPPADAADSDTPAPSTPPEPPPVQQAHAPTLPLPLAAEPGHRAATVADAPRPFEPLRFVRAHDLAVELEVLPFLSYALQHAGHGPVRQIRLHNQGREESQNLLLEVSLVPSDWGEPYTLNLARLGAGETWESGPLTLPLRLERLRQVAEKEHAHLRITVRDKDEVLLARTQELPVLAYNEWVYLPHFLQLTAAYVQPNSSALSPVLQAAAKHLQKATGSAAFAGYQLQQREHVQHMLAALHRALGHDLKLGYINPPPSFEHSGQKVRLVADTLEQGRGTCLDLALLQCALWEHIGLHPLLLLIPGHAFMAVWMDERHASQAVVRLKGGSRDAAARELAQALHDGALRVFNSTEITSGHTLAQAEQHGQALLQQTLDRGETVEWVDIRMAREQVTPLP